MKAGTGWTISGVTALVLGLGIGGSGGALAAVFGTDGAVHSGTHLVSTPTSALVVELDDIDGVDGLGLVVGDQRVRITADSRNGPAFLGIGRATDVDNYL